MLENNVEVIHIIFVHHIKPKKFDKIFKTRFKFSGIH